VTLGVGAPKAYAATRSDKGSVTSLPYGNGLANLSYMSTRDVMDQLHAAITALEEEDVRALPEPKLAEQIDQLVAILHQLDRHLARIANAVLARSFTVTEVLAA